MSKKNFEEAISLINSNRELLGKTYPQTDEEIKSVEDSLGVKFSELYVRFLKMYGILNFGSQIIYGLSLNKHREIGKSYGNIVSSTLQYRQKYSLPHNLIEIYTWEDGESAFLDTSKVNSDGEHPIVSLYIGSELDENTKLGVLAEDFGDFLLAKVEGALED